MILLAAGIADVAADDSSLFVLMLVMAVCFAIACVAIIVIALALVFAVLALSVAGILSAATIVGLYNRSAGKGFKAAVWMMSCFFGALSGLIVLWLTNQIRPLGMSQTALLSTGALLGLVAGIIGAAASLAILRWGAGRLKMRLSRIRAAVYQNSKEVSS